jgi:hypothetical protein
MGFTISYQEQMDYIQYWSYVGALLGVNENLLPKDGKSATKLDSEIKSRQFKTSEEGIELTKSLLNCFYSLNDEKQIKNKEIAGFMRYLLGQEVSDILNLPQSTFPISKQILLKLKTSVI